MTEPVSRFGAKCATLALVCVALIGVGCRGEPAPPSAGLDPASPRLPAATVPLQSAEVPPPGDDEPIVAHTHGLGFTPDGSTLRVATHHGLRIYSDGRWSTPEVQINDYMGYSATDSGFYSSGHPGDASRINPLGLVASSDGGVNLRTLGFEGESDFHVMGAGYRSHVIYVYNPTANSQIGPGIHYSIDEGRTWTNAAATGLPPQPATLAVHPDNPSVVAVGTDSGLFLSRDSGQSFASVGSVGPVTAVAFAPDDAALLFGFRNLWRSSDWIRVEPLATAPPIGGDDAMAVIASAPGGTDKIAVALVKGDIYLTENGGAAWQRIARGGS